MTKMEIFGVLVTIAYLLGVAAFLLCRLAELRQLELNEIGDFLAGSLGPLAIFWLVLGFFQQGAELRNSIQSLDLQTKELKQSVEAQKEMANAGNEQLQLQQDEFTLTIQELTKARRPKFVLTYLGIDDSISKSGKIGEDAPLMHRIGIANVGGTACEVEVFLGYGELYSDTEHPLTWPKVIWPQFETKYYYVVLIASDTHGDAIQLDVNFKDADGRQYVCANLFVRVSHGTRPKFEIQRCEEDDCSFIG
ncbi:hypothetical protein J3366_15505 [Tritonibacter mobilis]|uniref:hypothetical protein n=1 Tax=Tritonibacter mobilis TaxID=379347 RepID=UPI003BA89687